MHEPQGDPVVGSPELAQAPRRDSVETVIRTCPNCGAPLGERKCKLYCENRQCGYYLSCADYY